MAQMDFVIKPKRTVRSSDFCYFTPEWAKLLIDKAISELRNFGVLWAGISELPA